MVINERGYYLGFSNFSGIGPIKFEKLIREFGSADMRQVTVACKTGTAQHGGEQTLPHAWITLFAPAYDPQIVVTVLNEESGEGSNEAAPIAKEVLEEWFSK
jgi:cell division protein FtsI/penicillin-binding protein 2